MKQNIEKEIKQKNKVFFGLTLRQAISCVLIVVMSVLLTFIMGIKVSWIPCIFFAVIFYAVGWYEKDGMKAEHLLSKFIQNQFYSAGTRRFKIKNNYITTMNAEYTRHQKIDMSNKRIAKKIKNEKKKQTNHKSSLKSYK